MAGSPNVRLTLANRAENVLLVRQALSGLAETVGIDPVVLNDISTAVTEACNNVVMHAYRDGEGPMEVELAVAGDGVAATVRDHGVGIPPGVMDDSEETAGGIGLPVIQTLSETVDFSDLPGGGTEVAMRFAASPEHPPIEGQWDGEGEPQQVDGLQAPDVTLLSVGPTPVARGVVPRLLSTLAARAYFTTDRISDTQLLADALVAHSQGSTSTSRLSIAVGVEPRQLDVRIGPLRSGGAHAIFDEAAHDGLGPVLERLSDGHSVSAAGSAETLDLRLAQRG
jgi:serine/threonine-protein kinase RsbW